MLLNIKLTTFAAGKKNYQVRLFPDSYKKGKKINTKNSFIKQNGSNSWSVVTTGLPHDAL